MDLLDLLIRQRLLAIVRGTDPEAALRTVHTLAEAGIGAIEVSLTTPRATWVIDRARRALDPRTALGAGTVLTVDDAAAATAAGAAFLVTPGLGDDLRTAPTHAVPVLAGALTPSEIIAATARGAAAVKLFPASVGGPAYLRALREPFPRVPFLPVGGVGLDAAREYLAAGAVAVGVGSPLVGDAARGGDQEALRSRAAAWRAAVPAAEEMTA